MSSVHLFLHGIVILIHVLRCFAENVSCHKVYSRASLSSISPSRSYYMFSDSIYTSTRTLNVFLFLYMAPFRHNLYETFLLFNHPFLTVICMTWATVRGRLDISALPQMNQVPFRTDVKLQCIYAIPDAQNLTKITVRWKMRVLESTPISLWTASATSWGDVNSKLDHNAPDEDYSSPPLVRAEFRWSHNLTILDVNDRDSGRYFCSILVERTTFEGEKKYQQNFSNDAAIYVEEPDYKSLPREYPKTKSFLAFDLC